MTPPSPHPHVTLLHMSHELEFTLRDEQQGCPDCGGTRLLHSGTVKGLEGVEGRFRVFEHDHEPGPETFVEVTFGRRGLLGFRPDETFGARFGAVEGQDEPASTFVTGGSGAPARARLGKRLTRDEALVHPRADLFWHVNDLILERLSAPHDDQCACCGHDLDEHDRHVRFRLPDRVAQLPDAEHTAGIGLSDSDPMRADFLEAGALGCFVRSLLTIPLTEGYALTYGAWVKVTPETAQRIGRLWGSDLYVSLRFEGTLANELPLLGHLDAPVSAAVVLADSLPKVVGSTNDRLAADLRGPHDHGSMLEAAGQPLPRQH